MSQILIKYRPVPFIPLYRTFRRTFPDKWHNLSREQFIHCARFYENPLPGVEDKIILLKNVLHVPKRVFYAFSLWQIHNLLPLFDWLEKISFNKVFIKSFSIGDIVFHGPKDGFEDLTFDEFIVADTYFVHFLNTKDSSELYRLVYALYRPLDVATGNRLPMNGFNLDVFSGYYSRMKLHLLMALVFNFRVIRRWLEQTYPLIFPELPQEDPRRETQPGKIPTPKWTRIRQQLAGENIADIPQIGQLPLHTVFSHLSDLIKKSA
jgi:hypothetical protein